MNEWINDEIAQLDQAKEDQKARENRLELIRQHTTRLWSDLKLLIQDAAEQVNGSEKLRKHTGGLACQAEHTQKIEVNKAASYPAIYLIVQPGPNSIDIHRKIVINGANRRSREQKEKLDVDLDENGHPFFRNKAGEALLPEQAVHYIFRPFFHPELLEGESKRGIMMV
jgi:hypothetical protein